MNRKNIKRIIKWLIIGLFILITFFVLTFISQKRIGQFKDWASYSYKNLYFKYPTDFVVIFDSLVANQPNGFSLHIGEAHDGGMVPDGLYLSTFDTESDRIPFDPDRKFNDLQDRFKFKNNGTIIYAGCSSYYGKQTTVDLCNQIMSTVKIKRLYFFDLKY